MTTSPSEPVDNAQVDDADVLPSGGAKDDILSDGIHPSDASDDADESSASTGDQALPDPPD
jgi:hypothetical protein